MQCIKCDGELQRVTLGEVEVDKCVKCSGIWFDIGELDKVLESSSIDSLKNEIDNNQGQDEQKGKMSKMWWNWQYGSSHKPQERRHTYRYLFRLLWAVA